MYRKPNGQPDERAVSPLRHDSHPSRRGWLRRRLRPPAAAAPFASLLVLLVLSAALVVAACTREATPAPTPVPQPTPSPEVRVAAPTPVPTAPPFSPPPQAPPRSDAPQLPTKPNTLAETALVYLRHLAGQLGPRDLESGGERRAAEYVLGEFQKLGYVTQLQEFTIVGFSPDSGVTVLSPQSRDVSARPLEGSGQGQASGALVDVGLGRAQDVEGAALRGKVALLERGQIFFQEKVDNVARAGAVAAVVYNNRPGPLLGALTTGSVIPVVGIRQEEGQALRELLARGEVRAKVVVHIVSLHSQNIIAEKPGGSDRVVLLGGHYDTVPGVPGALDNASGTAAVLALAQGVAGKSFPFGLRFIAFGAEELGLLGSLHYVDSLSEEELERILAVLVFDVVAGSGPLEVNGDPELAAALQSLDPKLASSSLPPGVTSDHGPFLQADIPAVLLSTADLGPIHTPQDTLERVEPAPLAQSIALALAYLERLAQEG